MSDPGGGYQPQGAQPWHPGDPGYGGQQQSTAEQHQQQVGAWQQAQQIQGQQFVQAQYGQQGHPQQQGWQQDPYAQQQSGGWQQNGQQFGEQQFNEQQVNGQQYQGQQFNGQQQVPQQGRFPQGGGQFDQYGYQQQVPQPAQQQPIPPQFAQQAARQAPQPQAPRVPQPAGPGPDGIDWEAEAAALDAPAPAPAAEPAVEEWEPAADEFTEDEHAAEPEIQSFFGTEEEPAGRESERKRKEKGKQEGRRNKGACLIVALVLLGVTVGGGWWGYGFYQAHFGPPADYSGEGTGDVQVEIKSGTGVQMAQVLKDADVVKSTGAFVNAYQKNPKSPSIQPGFFNLHHQMSGEAAVAALIAGGGGNALTIPEGKKSTDIYALIDSKLKLQKGATEAAAKEKINELGLPDYAQGNIEGFLYPTKYSVSEGMKPEEMLKQMVSTANDHYKQLGMDAGAAQAGVKNGYEVLIEASIVQAEGNNRADFGKMARVISNRLKNHVNLGMDTTLQYQLGRTKLVDKEINDKSLKYNTYVNAGLPPGPIGNPGDDAIKAALNPTPGDWAYWIAMSSTETRFAATFDEHKKNVQEYCTAHGQGFDSVRGMCK
ncbi:endolytic transglycosylase MltG [Kitasatospora sp. GP82]|uniref:endolytic transglycosylase MltG n=1 Tax=Kitasatospora sp. GP82 TaxID=3035089 RepID=UPI0024757473|nr:endolytic transglycosylase MltG [Kitasatospora sp. GP82]MDH6130168.1 UPF0755 protein [Kitasatospora sp. GP82]